MVDPEAIAADILARVAPYVWDGATLPVPVEDIVDSTFGLHVLESDDLANVAGAPPGATVSGLLVVADREIWVSAAEAAAWPGRRRFTLGHELGHWCLHRGEHQRVFCRVAEETAAGEAIEAEASAFAGALLFPAALVRSAWDGDLEALCARFGGSRAATQRAVFRCVHRPAVLERSRGLESFSYDDAGYEAWRAAHLADGFVLNDDVADPAAALLHRASCSFLSGPLGNRPRTAQPKWATADRDALARTFPHARACTRCKP
ncbi:MAG: hypothetical protein QOF76_4890 [Solirubrobacteraceae bacterium]|jgi:hypothetical protein|nr:hypothetical protein [Solirubrobacteraceae bacterium]